MPFPSHSSLISLFQSCVVLHWTHFACCIGWGLNPLCFMGIFWSWWGWFSFKSCSILVGSPLCGGLHGGVFPSPRVLGIFSRRCPFPRQGCMLKCLVSHMSKTFGSPSLLFLAFQGRFWFQNQTQEWPFKGSCFLETRFPLGKAKKSL